ncbi:MAG: SsrA-binding protein SmpB [Bacteroidota bacterium]
MKGKNSTVVANRKARHEYHIEDTHTVGIVLTGTEVKSLRNGKASLQEAYCTVDPNDELFILKMTINPYDKGTYNNHEPQRPRKLLMKKAEIRKLRRKLEEKGYTLVPLKLFFNDKNLAKLNIGLAKGKKNFDKREDIKERDTKRELQRQLKHF